MGSSEGAIHATARERRREQGTFAMQSRSPRRPRSSDHRQARMQAGRRSEVQTRTLASLPPSSLLLLHAATTACALSSYTRSLAPSPRLPNPLPPQPSRSGLSLIERLMIIYLAAWPNCRPLLLRSAASASFLLPLPSFFELLSCGWVFSSCCACRRRGCRSGRRESMAGKKP